MSAAPPPPPSHPADAAAAPARAPGAAPAPPAATPARASPDSSADLDGGQTVAVDAALLASTIKHVEILCEALRRQDERAKRCRGCGGEADYLIAYGGLFYKGHTARVCERCMNETVVHKHGMDIYIWKHEAAKVECVRCGDDVTARGWCVCPRNARLARGDDMPDRAAGESAAEGGA